ncbi:MAG: sugar ABC transporter substrate-binding protein [Synergistaceae bacterium]|nr:sugar ABC transporter substrate-binding protein [Synergistaceae bacterium]
MKKVSFVVFFSLLLVTLLATVSFAQGKTYAYISPGPDTWYQRDVEGFQYGAEKNGDKVIVLNSEYEVEKEIANIEQAINQGVDGISMFSFNETGAIQCAQRAAKAGIPVLVTDSVGSVFGHGVDVVAAIDFDWTAMGVAYANWMAENAPGENFVIITGNFESVPCQKVNASMKETSEKLGKNKLLEVRSAHYNPNEAVNVAQDLVESGLDFGVMFIMDEDMAAAVIRMLESRKLLNNPIKVIAQNGSTAGIPLVKDGSLSYTISSSPGWEGLIAYEAMNAYVNGKIKDVNQQIMLPIMEVNASNIDDPMAVVPWEIAPDVYDKLTEKYFPQYSNK